MENEKECIRCGIKFGMREWKGERHVWSTVKKRNGESVWLCMFCRAVYDDIMPEEQRYKYLDNKDNWRISNVENTLEVITDISKADLIASVLEKVSRQVKGAYGNPAIPGPCGIFKPAGTLRFSSAPTTEQLMTARVVLERELRSIPPDKWHSFGARWVGLS